MVQVSAPEKEKIFQTPSMPENLAKVDLTDNARQVLMRRYVRRDYEGLH